jgi:hypothetical protein
LSAATTSAATRPWTFISSRNATRCWAARSGDRPVGEAEVLELPVEVDVGVAAAGEVAEEAVRAAAEPAARVAEREAGDQGPEPGLPQPGERGVDHGLGLGELRAMAQARGDQLIEGAFLADQAEYALRRLDRRDHDAGVEPEPAHRVGGIDLELAHGLLDVLALAFLLGQAAAIVGLKAGPGAGVGRHELGERTDIGRGLPGDGQVPRGPLQVQVRLGHAQEGVVRRRPDAGPAGGHKLPRGQRLEDGVREPEDRGQPADLRRADGGDRPADARTGRGRAAQEQRALADRADRPLHMAWALQGVSPDVLCGRLPPSQHPVAEPFIESKQL